MTFNAVKSDLPKIIPFRQLFLHENNFQVRYNACHERGWSDSYLLSIDHEIVGYGSVKGKENLADRDAIFEYYVMHSHRKFASHLFSTLIDVSKCSFIECQSNDLLLTALLYEHGQNIYATNILFEDGKETDLAIGGVIFRRHKEEDIVFEHKSEPGGDFVLELNNEIVATGGFMLHYNIPFADLFMEVKEEYRRKGLGSFLIQELKKICYSEGRVPAARCGISNTASKATLIKGGLKIAGFMLLGTVKER